MKGQCHFAFNTNLSNVKLNDIPPGVVVIFEADGDWNLNGGPELLKKRYTSEWFVYLMLTDGTIDVTIGRYYFCNIIYNHETNPEINTFYKNAYFENLKPRWKP